MSSYNFSKLTVLVVDDSYYIRQMVKGFLYEFEVQEVLEADDAQTGFIMFVEEDPDIVITDWKMGETSGLDLVYLIRWSEKSPNPFVPIIMLTGYTEIENVRKARDAGVSSYLAKPVSAGSLYKRLCFVVDDKRPFIRDGEYFGPDRRMKDMPELVKEERREPE